ncbi:MAG: hypothetical protein AABY22_33685 [Nanoarchaeota archaeon]
MKNSKNKKLYKFLTEKKPRKGSFMYAGPYKTNYIIVSYKTTSWFTVDGKKHKGWAVDCKLDKNN